MGIFTQPFDLTFSVLKFFFSFPVFFSLYFLQSLSLFVSTTTHILSADVICATSSSLFSENTNLSSAKLAQRVIEVYIILTGS